MKSKKRKWWIWIGIIVVVAGGSAVVFGTRKKDQRVEVTVETAATRRLISTVSATGVVEPVTQVKISAEIPGRIVQLPVKEGQSVQRGDFLLELDPKTYSAAAEGAQSALRSAKGQKDKADADLKRVKDLVAKGMSSQADLDAAYSQAEISAGQLEQAASEERRARENLYKTRISTPMSGTISRLNKEVGELTLGSQFQEDVIMIVADLSKMQVRAQVDENDIVGVKIGDSSLVEIDAYPDTSFVGVVAEISQSATATGAGALGGQEAKNFDVKVAIVDHIPGIRPGMSANVEIATDHRDDVLSVSLQCVAVRDRSEGKVVEIKDKPQNKSSRERAAEVKSGTADTSRLLKRSDLVEGVFVFAGSEAVWKPVKTGLSSDRYIEVISGIALGDSVISGPYRVLAKDLSDKDKIKLKSPEKAKDDKKKNG